MKNVMMAFINWLNDETQIAPRDGDRVMLGWRELNPVAAGDETPLPFGKIEMAVYLVALLVAFPVLAFSVELPVLVDDVKRGDVITEDNVEYKDLGNRAINDRIIILADDIIGQEAVRNIRAGRPLMENYIRVKPTVRKGDVVPLRYVTSGILLLAQGRVLEDAVAGDMVRLMNIDSRKTLQGRVLEGGTITLN